VRLPAATPGRRVVILQACINCKCTSSGWWRPWTEASFSRQGPGSAHENAGGPALQRRPLTCPACMFTYPMLLGTPAASLEDFAASVAWRKGLPVKKAIYAITLVLLGALIIQSVWGAEAGRGALVINAHSGRR
jgi:hypothetical protein